MNNEQLKIADVLPPEPPVGENQLNVDFPTVMLEPGTFKLGSVQRRQLRTIGLTRDMNPIQAIEHAINFTRYWNKILYNMPVAYRWNIESKIRSANLELQPPYSEPRTPENDEQIIDV